jgi:N-acetylmuramoyl-L-alanine amidase
VLAIAGRNVALGTPLLEEPANSAPENTVANAGDLAQVAPASTPLPRATPVANLVTPVPLATQSATPTSVGPATLSSLDERPSDSSFDVHLAIVGQPTYRWHMLGDGRFYIDILNAHLAVPSREESLNDPRISSLRVRENGTPDNPSIRIAMGLIGQQPLQISSDATSLLIRIGKGVVADAGRYGAGRVGSADVVAESATPIVPSVDANLPGPTPAVFGPIYPVGGRSRIIVLDPGHGGSDTGALGNGLVEKTLTLDIARRLRTLLVARGWQVIMTRDSDVDVYQPNDSAREELQARCDVANRAGARLFVSIHINAFTTPDLQGTTTYYYKPGDAHFADVVDHNLNSILGTQDDGARRENYYVVRHTTMPAILVETAFLSNASDAARLRQPTFRQNVAVAITNGITSYVSEAPAPATGSGAAGSAGSGNAIGREPGEPPADDLTP